MDNSRDIYEALARIHEANHEFFNDTASFETGAPGTYNPPIYVVPLTGGGGGGGPGSMSHMYTTSNTSASSFPLGSSFTGSLRSPEIDELRAMVNSLRTEVTELKKRLDASEQLEAQPEHRRISPNI